MEYLNNYQLVYTTFGHIYNGLAIDLLVHKYPKNNFFFNFCANGAQRRSGRFPKYEGGNPTPVVDFASFCVLL